MTIYRRPGQYANRTAADHVQEAMQLIGEECILLHMYRPTIDAGIQPRCSKCYDEHYEQSGDFECNICYGTTFEGGVKTWGRVWSIFTDMPNEEKYARRGEYTPDDRSVQLESTPVVYRHDYIVRVLRWSPDHRPLQITGRYVLDRTEQFTLRTGQRFGQQLVDKYGQKATAHLLPPTHPIYLFNIPPTQTVSRPPELVPHS